MSRRRSAIEDLRLAIDCLPLRTREAMLHGIRTNDIIVGAYTDRAGGVCPMLAAHRNGGRTSFISFARAWDRFAGARRARKATKRELRVLESHLEASIVAEADRGGALATGIAEHQELLRDRKTREAARTGFGWLEALARADELDLGDDAGRAHVQQRADGERDVVRRDHLVGRH
jgi:hypothetical protein